MAVHLLDHLFDSLLTLLLLVVQISFLSSTWDLVGFFLFQFSACHKGSTKSEAWKCSGKKKLKTRAFSSNGMVGQECFRIMPEAFRHCELMRKLMSQHKSPTTSCLQNGARERQHCLVSTQLLRSDGAGRGG